MFSEKRQTTKIIDVLRSEEKMLKKAADFALPVAMKKFGVTSDINSKQIVKMKIPAMK